MKTFKFLFVLLLYLIGNQAFAQTTVNIGNTSGGTTRNYPISPYYNFCYSQQIILQSEINTAGSITAINFYSTGTSFSNSRGWTIYMGHTSKTNFASTTDWLPLSEMTQVYSGTVNNPSSTGWYSITLDAEFLYNNTSNLVIAIDENASNYDGTSSSRYFNLSSLLASNRVIYYESDYTNPNPASPPTASSRANYLNSMQLLIHSCTSPDIYIVSGGGAICSNQTASIFLSSSQTGVNYQLYNESTPVGSTTSGTGNSLLWDNISSAGSYTVKTTTSGSYCVTTMNGSASVTLKPSPTNVVAGTPPSPFCSGGSAQLNGSADAANGTVYYINETFDGSSWPSGWTVSASTVGITVSNTNNAGGSPNEAFFITGSSSSGTDYTARLFYGPINTNGKTSINLTFLTSLLRWGSTGSLTAAIQTSTNGSTWANTSWSKTISSTGYIGNESISLTSSDGVGSSTLYLAITVTGRYYYLSRACFDNIAFYVSESHPVAFSWSGGPFVNGQNSESPLVNPLTTTTYTMTAISNGCSLSDDVTVTVNPTPSPPEASYNNPVCSGGTLTLSASTIPSATYSWTGPNSFTSSTQNPTVSTSATQAMEGTYNVTATVSGCTSSAGSTAVTILSGAGTPGSITGLSTQCPNLTGQTYSIDAVQGATGYLWSVPTGWSISAGQNSTSITVTTGNEGQGGVISVSAVNSCGPGTASTLTVSMATMSVAPTTVHIANNNTCTGVLKTLSISDGILGTGGVWQWHSGSCSGTVVALGTSHSINPPSGTSVNYYIKAVGLCNTTACVSGTVNVLPDAPPQPGVISGISEQEAGLTGQIYSINPVSGATSYLWSVPQGWQITAGQGTTSITVTTGQEGDDGLITVSSGNACGYSNFSPLDVTVTQQYRTLTLSDILLEGLYNSGSMNQSRNATGTQYSSGVADIIQIELRSAADYQTIVYTATDVALSTTGTASADIPSGFNGQYYITINHRNSLNVTTASSVSFAGGALNYSFANPSNVYGGNLKNINGNYVIYGGDANKDGIIDATDMTAVNGQNESFATGYMATDINGDGLVDSSDMTVIDNNTGTTEVLP